MPAIGKNVCLLGFLVVGWAALFLFQQRSAARLREENRALREQSERVAQLTLENQQLAIKLADLRAPAFPAPRLPAPAQTTSGVPEVTTEISTSNSIFLDLFHGGDGPLLTQEQIENYLKDNHRSAASLLTAFRASKDTNFLAEALEKYPDDPQVHYAAVYSYASPEERRQRVESFKQAAPDNALANYLSAFDYLKAGQNDLALQELTSAAGKGKFTDYSLEFLQNSEEAWRAAGYSVADAKTVSSMQLLLPDLQELRNLSRKTVALADAYRQAGDDASADALYRMNIGLGQRFNGSPGEPLISQLVGIAIEADALRAMPPSAEYAAGQTVQQRLDDLLQQNSALKDLAKMESLLETMPPQDVISYWDRWRGFGTEPTLRWAAAKYAK